MKAIPFFILGVIALILLVGIVIPIQMAATGIFFSGGALSLHPNLSIYQQAYDLFSGTLSDSQMIIVFPMIAIEFLALAYVFVFKLVMDIVKKHHPELANWVRTFLYIAIGFDILTDFLFAPYGTIQARLGFALVVVAVFFVAGWVAMASIEHGFKEAHA